MTKYLAVWIDHKEARVFPIHEGKVDETTVSAPLKNIHHKHAKGGSKEPSRFSSSARPRQS
jgi:hypothetical protein